MAKEENGIIQSVDRALTLIDKISEMPETGASLNELAGELGIDRSSVFRLLSTLSRYDVIRQVEGSKKYKLGYGIYTYAGRLRVQEKLTDAAAPFLDRLVERTGENAHLAVRTRSLAVFIDRKISGSTLTANTNIGDAEELYCTAVGKSLISSMSREEIEALLPAGSMVRYTENTLAGVDQLMDELALIRRRGWAVDNEEFEYNIVCLAAPVYNFENKIEAAVGISGPKIRLKDRIEEVGEIVGHTALELSRQLGWNEQL